jgi:hypothetical protein
MFDPRTTLQQQVSDQLKDHFGDKVFDTVIPRNVRLAEAPSYGLPGVVFDPPPRAARPLSSLPKRWCAASRRCASEHEDNSCRGLTGRTGSYEKQSNGLNPFGCLLLPGWQNSDAGHWQSRWEQLRLPAPGAARLAAPAARDWSARLQEHLVDAPAPVVLVAHSLGCMLAAWWAAHSPLARTKVRAPCWWLRATWSSRTCARSCRAGRRCCCRPCPSLDAGGQQQRPVLRPGARAAVAQAWGSRGWMQALRAISTRPAGWATGMPATRCWNN